MQDEGEGKKAEKLSFQFHIQHLFSQKYFREFFSLPFMIKKNEVSIVKLKWN